MGRARIRSFQRKWWVLLSQGSQLAVYGMAGYWEAAILFADRWIRWIPHYFYSYFFI
jgi:hypothetical protein